MVAVVHHAPQLATPDALPAWLEKLGKDYTPEERTRFRQAVDFALKRYSDLVTIDGEPLADRAFGAAAILAGLHLDAESVLAALLMETPRALALAAADGHAPKPADRGAVAEQFGEGVAALVDGMARIDEVQALRNEHAALDGKRGKAESAHQVESLRKMLLAMAEDLRVVLLKLAERTQALRYLMTADEASRRAVAQETLDLFAPLANRLGIWQIKWELEDLSLRSLEPQVYKEIAKGLDERRIDRERYIRDVMSTLQQELAAVGIKAEISGRPKHIYSIYKKMRRKKLPLSELYDIRAVRLLVRDIKDCYTALGIVHNRWTPIPKEFDDYIAKPKGNNYQSLHTAVIGPEGKSLEVQIRTHEMHQNSEFGVAAHWRYKEGSTRSDVRFDEKIAWLRQVLEWRDEVAAGEEGGGASTGELLQQFKTSLFQDVIYVLTPQGKVIDLPRGATPIDFAYSVHTNLGHRCRGAKVDGNMVPLNYPLQNGQRVEVITVRQGGPSRDWLNPSLGFVQSHRARTKVRQWFNALQLQETIQEGRNFVEQELRREGATAQNLDGLAHRAGFDKLDDFFAAVGRGAIGHKEIVDAIRGDVPAETPTEEAYLPLRKSRAEKAGKGILIVGVDQLLTGLAKCCKPAPPDPIVGFVTRGKGITIHRQSCANVRRLEAADPQRLIEADWGERRDEVFPADIEVIASDRQGLLRDISEVLAREKINVTAVNTQSKNMQARMMFTVEIRSLEQLRRTLALVQEVPGVFEVRRR